MIDHSKDCPGCHGGNPLVHTISVTAEFNLHPSRTERVNRYIEKWQSRLGLSHWVIRYNPDRAVDDDSDAHIYKQEPLRLAEIIVSPSIPDDEVEYCVVHEMLHPLVSDYESLALRCAGGIGGPGAMLLMDELGERLETLLETLAGALIGQRQLSSSNSRLHLFGGTVKDAE